MEEEDDRHVKHPFLAKTKKGMKKTRTNQRASPGGEMSQLTIQKGPVFSARQRTVLRYCDYIAIDAALGITADYVFSCNGIYDTNVTGTGHQPLGFDQWMTFYDHYHVVGSKLKATIIPSDTTAANAAAFGGVIVRDAAGSLSANDVTALLEQRTLGTGTCKQIPLAYDRGTVVMGNYNYAKFHGVTDLLASSVLRGDASNNPSEQAYYHVWVGPLSAGLNLPALIVSIEMEFDVVFSEPKLLNQS